MSSSKSSANESVIRVEGVSRRFGAKLALDGVSLNVGSGQVVGLVGANGAGKTTLIKHILGLLAPAIGTVRIFGFDPVIDPPSVLGRIGYLSEDRDLPAWMQVDELLGYTSAFYPKWDREFAEDLRRNFQLDSSARIKTLSRGELAKAGLIVALAHRPELLVLDEPSSGLDPVVRREMLEAVVRAVADEGRTVLFSSHLLDEIERVSDRIAMMANGQIILNGPLNKILETHHRLTLRFERAPATPPRFEGALGVTGDGLEWTVLCIGDRSEVVTAAKDMGASVVAEQGATLDEIFIARVGRGAGVAQVLEDK